MTKSFTNREKNNQPSPLTQLEAPHRESLLQLLIANVTDYAIFILSPEGLIQTWNAGAERIKGYQADEILGRHFSIFYDPESIAQDFPAYELKTAKSTGRFEHEGWRIRKDGSRFWANVIINPLWGQQVWGQQDELLGFSKITRDLTERKKAEERLKENNAALEALVAERTMALEMVNERYRLVIEGSNDAFWDWDIAKDERVWSERLYHILGLEKDGDPLKSETVLPWVHPEDRERVWQLAQSHLENPDIKYETEYRFLHASGSYRTCISRGEAQRDASGKPVRMAGMITDITDRKRMENALKESEARFRAMADSAPLFIWLSGPDGKPTYVNKTWVDFLGLSVQDVLDFGMVASMLPEEQKIASEAYQTAFTKREPYTIEARFRNAVGEFRWLLSNGAPLFLPNGELAGYIGTSIDITDRKIYEEQLQGNLSREQLIRQIVEITAQSFDIDLILKTVAEALGRFLGTDRCSVNHYAVVDGVLLMNMDAQYTREGCLPIDSADTELIAKAVRHLSPEVMTQGDERILNISDQKSYIEHLKARMLQFEGQLPGLTTEQLIEIVLKYEVQSSLRVNIFYRGTPYGSISLSQCTHNRIWLPEEVELVKTIAHHAGSAIYQAELYNQAQATAIREQQAREQLEVYTRKLEISNRELEEFASIASHDLQEPLRKIQLFSGMLAERTGPEGHDIADRIQGAITRMQHLISDLLSLSRITRKARPFKKVNLETCLDEILHVLELPIQETNASVIRHPLDSIDADESQISQLFQNLISNALKFKKPDTPPVIEINGTFLPGGFYRITIQDNGIGFDDKYKERIFAPFERIHGKYKFPGTGIGLAICNRIAERHGGTISASGQPNEGALFTIVLPVTQAG